MNVCVCVCVCVCGGGGMSKLGDFRRAGLRTRNSYARVDVSGHQRRRLGPRGGPLCRETAVVGGWVRVKERSDKHVARR